MRFSWVFTLGLALGAQAQDQVNRFAARQNGGAQTTSPPPTVTSPTGGGTDSSSTSSSAGGGGSDTTTTVTVTVTGGSGGSTVSKTTTVNVSSVTTVTVTSTNIATTTVTKSDNDTSTKTIYITSTQTVNMKRSVDGNFEPIGDVPAQAEAEPTGAPTATGSQGGYPGMQRIRNDKRAIVTSTVTVTAGGGGGATTVFETVTKNIKSTTTAVVQVTSFVTETYQANAKTTVTETSTIIAKLTVVSTGAIETSTSTPTGSPSGNNNNNDSGLSTGAKAGIGVGAGVAALAVIGGLLWFCMRRRRSPKLDHDDLLGPSSEVPVGTAGSRHSRPMSEGLTSTPGTVPRRSPVLPNVQPEGYRGTAMGDGRAGYAKPDPYGAAYAPTRSTTNSSPPTRTGTLSPGDQLPRHPTPDHNTAASVSPLSGRPQTAELGNDGAGARWHASEAAEMATDNPSAAKWHSDNAHEIDSQPVMNHQSGPVYEMPSEHFK